jgi:hypothetical protein
MAMCPENVFWSAMYSSAVYECSQT